VVAAALVWATLPAPVAQAESADESMGVSIAVGLLAAVVIVYGLVSLRSDVERYAQADSDAALERAAQIAAESPVVLQTLTAPIALGSTGGTGGTEIAGAAVGLRLTF
jgi:hypothetical protein